MKPIARMTFATLAGFAAVAPLAHADDPLPSVTQSFIAPEEVKSVVWKATAKAGLLVAYGNANIINFNGGLLVSRHDGKNRIELTIDSAYGLNRQAEDKNKNGTIDSDDELNNGDYKENVANLLGKFRYDRFLTVKDSIYLFGFGGFDFLAGKKVIAGAQAGYSRKLVKNEKHDLGLEIGVDYTLNLPVDGGNAIHLVSGRVFAGYVYSVGKSTTLSASVEALVNFNPIKISAPGGKEDAYGPAGATRVIGKLGLTTKLTEAMSFNFGMTGRFENATLYRSPPAGFKFGDAGVRARQFDLITDASLIVSFL